MNDQANFIRTTDKNATAAVNSAHGRLLALTSIFIEEANQVGKPLRSESGYTPWFGNRPQTTTPQGSEQSNYDASACTLFHTFVNRNRSIFHSRMV
jgi:hypothetical protein